jgi:hypothetical protein
MLRIAIAPQDVALRGNAAEWDAFLAGLPGATPFHSSAWARVLQDSYGYRACYLSTPSEAPRGTIAIPDAVLPLVEVNSWLTGRRGISLPFTDECPALGDSPNAVTLLQEAALEQGVARGWKYLEFRGGPRPRWASETSTTFLGHTLSLNASETALFAGINPAGRRAIRKAEQNNVTVERSQSLDAVRHLYQLLRVTRRRHGVPPQPFRFFENLHRHFLSTDRGTVYLAKAGGTVVAGALFLQTRHTALFKFGASDERFQQLRPNNLIMWHAIKDYAAQGVQKLDFGRTSVGNDGLRKFKLSWGTEERSVEYYRYDFQTRSSTPAPDRSDGRHAAFFRKLPLGVSAFVGALLYRHIA